MASVGEKVFFNFFLLWIKLVFLTIWEVSDTFAGYSWNKFSRKCLKLHMNYLHMLSSMHTFKVVLSCKNKKIKNLFCYLMYILSKPTFKCEKIKWAIFSVVKYDRYIFVAEWHSVTFTFSTWSWWGSSMWDLQEHRAQQGREQLLPPTRHLGGKKPGGKRLFGKI